MWFRISWDGHWYIYNRNSTEKAYLFIHLFVYLHAYWPIPCRVSGHMPLFLYDPQVLVQQMRSNDYVVVSFLGLILHLCKSDMNYALERYAWQKDIWGNVAFPSRAVDGNSDPAWYGNSCAMTASAQKPWWAVDLGQIIRLTKIVVTNRIENRKTC